MSSEPPAPVFFLLRRRLPSSESSCMLGRVVRSFQDPTFDYTPASPSALLSPETYKTFLMAPQHEDAAKITAKASRDSRLAAKLHGLLSFSSALEDRGSTSISSPRVTTRRLRLEPDYFKALAQSAVVREKLLDMCPRGGKIYLIVGTMSFHTANLDTAGNLRKQRESKATVAAGTAASAAAAAAGGFPALAGNTANGNLDLEYGRTSSSDWTMESEATATGQDGEDDPNAQEIFAVAYRVLTRELMGLGNNVVLSRKPPAYRGGQHFGEDDDEDDEEDEDDENDIESEIQTLKLSTDELSPATIGAVSGNPVVLSEDGDFLYS